MTGVKAPVGVLGASVVVSHGKTPLGTVGTHIASNTLPFTGVALSVYMVAGALLIATGLFLRALGRTHG